MAGADLTAIARHRKAEPPKLIHLVRGDLDWIVMKCLEKDRTRRYETANGLAMDILRHLNCEPVVARPPSRLYEFQKTVRRHKFGFAAAAALIMVLAVGALVSTLEALRAKRAVRQQSRLREAAQNAQAKETQMRQLAEPREIATRRNAYASDLITANLALGDGNLGLARTLLSQHQPEPNQEDLRGFEWRYLWGKSRGEQIKTLAGHSNFVICITFSPDGTMLASGSSDHTVKLWNAHTGELIANCAGHTATVISVAFSPNGELFASGGEDDLVRLWDAHTYQIVLTLTNQSPFLAFSGSLLAIGTGGNLYGDRDGGTVQLWNYATGQMVADLPESGDRAVFSPDGRMLATANWHGLIKVWSLDDRSPLNHIQANTFVRWRFRLMGSLWPGVRTKHRALEVDKRPANNSARAWWNYFWCRLLARRATLGNGEPKATTSASLTSHVVSYYEVCSDTVKRSRQWRFHPMANLWPAAAWMILSCFGILMLEEPRIRSPISQSIGGTTLDSRFFLPTEDD